MNNKEEIEMNFQKLAYITFFVADMDKSLEFYTEILNLPLRSKDTNFSQVGGQDNGVFIGLLKTNKVKLINDPSMDSPSITFEVDDIHSLYHQLKEKGVKFIRDLSEEERNFWSALFVDLDNNKIWIVNNAKYLDK